MTRRCAPALAALLSACCAAPPPPPAAPPAPAAAPAPAPPAAPPAAPAAELPRAAPPPLPRPAPEPPLLCQNQAPTLALTLVLDRSGSMTGTPLQMTKAAARRTVEALAATEAFEVIAFDSLPTRFVRMTCGKPASATLLAIDRITAGGGTEVFPALDLAYTGLAATSARRKHIVLLSDGRSPPQGTSELVATLAAEGMTLSTVALGADADEVMLRTMAAKGGGRFHQVKDAAEIAKVFTAELTAARGGR